MRKAFRPQKELFLGENLSLVLGSFIKAGDVFATDVKVLDVETKKLLRSASSKGEGVGSILERQIGELSKDISRGIGISDRKIEETQLRIADVATSSMEAYKYFLRGIEALDKLYYNESRQFLEKVVELDPKFAVAFLCLGLANQWLGNSRASNEYFEKAMTFSEKATDKDRLYIEAFYSWFRENNPETGRAKP